MIKPLPLNLAETRAETDLNTCGKLLDRACDEIERLRAENSKLRVAVRVLARNGKPPFTLVIRGDLHTVEAADKQYVFGGRFFTSQADDVLAALNAVPTDVFGE